MRKHRSHDVVPVDDCLIAGAQPSYLVRDVAFEVGAETGFWQVHPGAPETLVATVLGMLGPRPGESVLDLYAGVGLFARFLAEAVGPAGAVTLVEGDSEACGHAAANVPGAEVHAGDVARVLGSGVASSVDLVVLDPPRTGAKRAVVEHVVARRPRAVAYVACDPAALARDVAIFAEHDYALSSLQAFDQFPMTHHVECVALLTPAQPIAQM
jgi:tRNA/tmRNA/rRNA uracil-C5-methylase (TrmA/RlmC/RlmD family)